LLLGSGAFDAQQRIESHEREARNRGLVTAFNGSAPSGAGVFAARKPTTTDKTDNSKKRYDQSSQ
jgi:hypothetical protein